MKLHANARTCPHCRSLIVRRVIDDGQPPTTVATEFRVSSRTLHKWVTRYRKDGEDGLVDKSSRPHKIPRQQLQPGKELHDAVMSLLHTTAETLRLVELIRKRYAGYRRLFLSWDAAPWHSSKTLIERIEFLNQWAEHDAAPQIEIMPLPSRAQFLNVIESVFSGMARAIIHNSNYRTVEDAQTAIVRYIDERNSAFQETHVGLASPSGERNVRQANFWKRIIART